MWRRKNMILFIFLEMKISLVRFWGILLEGLGRKVSLEGLEGFG